MLIWIILSITLLLFLVIVAIQMPPVQKYLTHKGQVYLEKKLHTKVSIGGIYVGFPKDITLKDIYVEDQKKDTLLYSHKLAVNLAMWELLHNKIKVSGIYADKITAHIYRLPDDTLFNYSFIMQAFAGDPTKPKKENTDTTKKAWEIALSKVELKDIYFTFKDSLGGNDIYTRLGYFSTTFKDFDLKKQIFKVGKLKLENTSARFVITAKSKNKDTSVSPLPSIGLDKATLKNVSFVFNDKTTGSYYSSSIGNSEIEINVIDLNKQVIDIDHISLDKANTKIVFNKPSMGDSIKAAVDSAVTIQPDEKAKPIWHVKVAGIKVNNNNLQFDNNLAVEQKHGIDYNHLALKDLNIDIQDAKYNGMDIKTVINQLTFADKSGFVLKNFQSQVTFDSTHAELSNLDIKTNNSHIKNHLYVGYPSIKAISKDLNALKVDIDLDNTIIALSDVLYFAPQLRTQPPFKSQPNLSVRISTDIKGTIGNLNIRQFLLQTRSTTVAITGNIKGLPDAKTAYYYLNINRLSSTRGDILALAPKGSIPESIIVPSNLGITGFYHGTLKKFTAKANINSSVGKAFVLATLANPQETYTVDLTTDHLNIGKILAGQDSLLGPVTMKALVKGQGFDPKKMKATFEAVVKEAVVKGYSYNDLKAQGNYMNQMLTATALMKDSNVNFTFDGKISFDPHKPTYDFILNLKNADLYALHFSKSELKVKGVVLSNIQATGYDNMKGTIGIKNVVLQRGEKKYYVDSLLFASVIDKNQTDIKINSDIMSGYLKGTLNIKDLPNALRHHMARYFVFPHEKDTSIVEGQNFEFALKIHNTELLTDVLVPGLDKFIPGELKGSYNSSRAKLDINIDMPLIVYNGMTIDSLNIAINSNKRQLKYAVKLEKFEAGSFAILNPALEGSAANDSLNVQLSVKDESDKKRFMVSGMMNKSSDDYRFMMLPEGVILNYQSWAVHDGSYLKFGKSGFYAHDFVISRGDSMLSVDTKNSEGEAVPLSIGFKHFSIAGLSSIAEGKEELFRGLLEGNVTFKELDSTPVITADMAINNFSFKANELGNIAIKADNITPNRYTASLKLSGNGNDLAINGYYSTVNQEQPVNATLNIQTLNLHSIEPYLGKYLRDMSGRITGKLDIKGTLMHPSIIGQIEFPESGFTVNYLQNHFKIENEKIIFENKGIYFPSFTMLDSAGNKANVDGYVYAKYFDDIKFDLKVTTDGFRALNTTKVNNQDFYGKLLLTSNIYITGSSNLPVIRGNINIIKGTDFTYVLPGSQKGIEKTTGIVDWIDMDTIKSMAVLTRPVVDTTKKDSITKLAELQGIDINMNITIVDGAIFKVVVDPLAGDNLVVNGAGNLSFSVNPSGAVALTGRIAITDGEYNLSFYNFVRRKFDIQSGSSITWFGNPTDAVLDITALYKTKASTLSLVENQLTDASSAERNQYKQKLPVEVVLNLTGELLKPEVKLGLRLPDAGKAKANALILDRFKQINDNQSETNKQAFALLVSGQFLADDPLNSGSGSENGLSSAVASSLSQMLGMELNKLAGQYVKGIDINVGLDTYQDYSSGSSEEVSKLNIGLSKQFLSDRLTVSVGSNIDVYGHQAGNQNVSQIVGDVNVEYMLTPQGQLRIRIFRNEQYEGIITGQIIETGIGLIFVRDFNRFRQLFKSPRNNVSTQSIENATP